MKTASKQNGDEDGNEAPLDYIEHEAETHDMAVSEHWVYLYIYIYTYTYTHTHTYNAHYVYIHNHIHTHIHEYINLLHSNFNELMLIHR